MSTLPRNEHLVSRRGIMAGIVGLTIVLDQAVKVIARAQLAPHDTVRYLWGLVHLQLGENPGSFLGLGSALPLSVRLPIFGLLGVLLLGATAHFVWRASRMSGIEMVGTALILGGGLSNLLDRLYQGGVVTDYVILGTPRLHTGVFNAADLALVVGMGMVALGMLAGDLSQAQRESKIDHELAQNAPEAAPGPQCGSGT